MKYSFTLLTLSSVGLAFPAAQQNIEARQRQGLVDSVGDGVGGLLTNLAENVESLLGSVATSVDPDNLRPEPGYEFIEPGPGDSRGPCPGLNLMANYGYLPRDGHVTASQVIEGVARCFNMGADLATVLAVFAVLSDGDLATESWYLGSGPGAVGGLNRHNTVEADISPNKEDYYNGCGDTHSISSRIFKQNVGFVAQDPKKEFSYEVMRKQYEANSKFSQANNPYLYYFPFPSIVSVVAFNFYPEYFSNGTYGQGGTANYESISSIVGAKFDEKTGEFQYVPERWPENWYRRATPYGAVEALVDGFTRIYPANPVPMVFGQLGTDNFNVQTALCDIFSGVYSITPIALAGQVQDATAGITWALGKLTNVGLDGTVLGCPSSDFSPNFENFNNTASGGPMNIPLPDAQVEHSGNNSYYKTYFCEAPVNPTCQITC